MSSDKETLYIPSNIKTRSEVFPGFGFPELMRSLLCAGACVLAVLLLYANTGSVTASVVTMVAVVGLSVAVQVRDDHNLSMCDQIGYMIGFARQQRRFWYRYQEEWE